MDRSFTGLIDLERRARELSELKGMSLTLACLPALAFEVVPRAMAALRSDSPGISVALETLTSKEVVKSVRSGDVELGICNIRELDETVTMVRRHSAACVLCVSGDHDFARKGHVHVDDLETEDIVSVAFGYLHNDGYLSEQGEKFRDGVKLNTPSSFSALPLVLCGQGIAISDPYTAAFFVPHGLVGKPMIPEVMFETAIVTRIHHKPSRIARLAITAISSEMARFDT